MIDPVDLPDEAELEQRHTELIEAARTPHWLPVGFGLLVALVAAALTLQYLTIHPVVDATKRLAEDTNTAVNKTVAARDETIADQKIVIDQAVAAITQMARQIIELGGDPPEVILNPDRDDPPP